LSHITHSDTTITSKEGFIDSNSNHFIELILKTDGSHSDLTVLWQKYINSFFHSNTISENGGYICS